METDRKLILLFASLFLLIIIAFANQAFFSPGAKNSEPEIFTISKGESVRQISLNLKKAGLINSPDAFIFYTFILGKYGKIQAGDYLLSSQMSTSQIVNAFVGGETAKETLTILEGWNLNDIDDYLQSKKITGVFSLAGTPAKKETNKNVNDLVEKFDFLKDKPQGLSLEGYLFPDTYYIDKSDTAETFIEKALSNFNQKLTPDLRNEIKRQNKTIFEIVTMASMIEKEVKTPEDKKVVSGILWKRIQNKMGLQVDSTVMYAIGKENSKVYIKDTQFDSPYNTYKYRGLPLGPICNPGMDSIIAAIYPTETNYLYYLSTPEGKTIFSKTLEEHNYNKAKYLK